MPKITSVSSDKHLECSYLESTRVHVPRIYYNIDVGNMSIGCISCAVIQAAYIRLTS